jgi:hypothetical protein
VLCREYFVDRGGHLPSKERAQLLQSSGTRRCSIDLSTFMAKMVCQCACLCVYSCMHAQISSGNDVLDVMSMNVLTDILQGNCFFDM